VEPSITPDEVVDFTDTSVDNQEYLRDEEREKIEKAEEDEEDQESEDEDTRPTFV